MKLVLFTLLTLFLSNNIFAQSFIIKKQKDFYGVRDKKTKIDIIPYEYDSIEEFGTKESFFILSKNGKKGIVDSKNQIIFPLTCDSIVPTNKDFAINYYVYQNSKLGYINHYGHSIPIDYEKIREVYKKKLIVKKNGKYGVLHSHGEIIYDFNYDEILSFSDDYLCAKIDTQWLGIKDNKVIHKGKDVLFYKADEMASYDSCSDIKDPNSKFSCIQKCLTQVVTENAIYPEKAKLDKKEGVALIEFIIDENGNIIDSKMLRDIEGYFEEECKRVIKLFPKFNPAFHEGKAVKCVMAQVFKFKLK